jgi:hypothetical protein
MKEFITKNKELLIGAVCVVSILVLFFYVNRLYNKSMIFIQDLNERVVNIESVLTSPKKVRFVSNPAPVLVRKQTEIFTDEDLDKVVEEEIDSFKDIVIEDKDEDELQNVVSDL